MKYIRVETFETDTGNSKGGYMSTILAILYYRLNVYPSEVGEVDIYLLYSFYLRDLI